MSGINKKILEIQQEISVQKTGYDERNNYHYFAASDVLDSVRIELNKRNIITRTVIRELQSNNFYDTNGRNRPRHTILGTVEFIDTDDDSAYLADVIATGSDTGGDKGPRKAHTQLRKVAFLDTFLISESGGFDSDADPEAEPVNMTAPAAPQATVAGLMDEIGKLVNDKVTDGPTVNTVGSRIAKELGIDPTPKAWRRDSRVLEPLIAAIVAGEVE